MQPFCHISVSQGNALEILKIVEIAISKRSRQSYEIKQSRAFMESLIPEFGQFSRVIAKFLFLEARLTTMLCLCSTLRFY